MGVQSQEESELDAWEAASASLALHAAADTACPAPSLPPQQDGFLLKEPRSSASGWRALVRPVVGGMSLEADVSPLAELLNVAFARHELTSDHTDAALAWLEAHGKESIDTFL